MPYAVSKRTDVELRQGGRARCIAVHPGTVQTDMSGGKGELTPEQSAAAIVALLLRGPELQGGLLYSYDGSILPW
jgi:NAD(P)-dependent dehydrogenase (short-subunit alcohol dehydrogenase family)